MARAFASIKGNLRDIQLFHTDRGNEFKNKLIDETLNIFEIGRSLSMKGCPYDNAVAEATFKIIKTEFATLGYLSPLEYKKLSLKKVV
ncbi:transposase InsO family protein [Peribacillus simplex]